MIGEERDALKAESAERLRIIRECNEAYFEQTNKLRAAESECAKLRVEVESYQTHFDGADEMYKRATRAEARLEAMTGDAAVAAANRAGFLAFNQGYGNMHNAIKAALAAARAEVCK